MVLPHSILAIWAVLLPWIFRKAAVKAQLKADQNASLLIENQQIANSIIKRSRFSSIPQSFGPIETWELLLHRILYPSLDERLRNLNFEIKDWKIEIRKVEER
jgi:hypothetical protein